MYIDAPSVIQANNCSFCSYPMSYITSGAVSHRRPIDLISAMPPNIRLKGPVMTGSRVSIHSEYHVKNRNRVKRLTVTIKVDPYKLRQSLDMNVSDSDSDLWSLDQELNKTLQEPTQALSQHQVPNEKSEAISIRPANLDELYRTIPKNLVSTINRELGDVQDMIDRMIFTLKDPLTATRIRLPVRSTVCVHFECFDFDNFCEFAKIPAGVKAFIRKDLVKRSYELKRYEKLVQNDAGRQKATPPQWLQPIQHTYLPTIPTYNCPVCNAAFPLHQLYISDVFNFFIKFTPNYVHRIEITDRIRYRIIEDEKEPSAAAKSEEIVLLSDDDDEVTVKSEPSPKPSPKPRPRQVRKSLPFSDDVFDDGLDEQLARIEPGSGRWDDPVTID